MLWCAGRRWRIWECVWVIYCRRREERGQCVRQMEGVICWQDEQTWLRGGKDNGVIPSFFFFFSSSALLLFRLVAFTTGETSTQTQISTLCHMKQFRCVLNVFTFLWGMHTYMHNKHVCLVFFLLAQAVYLSVLHSHTHTQIAAMLKCSWCWSGVSWLENRLEASFSSKLFTYSPLAALQCWETCMLAWVWIEIARLKRMRRIRPSMSVYLKCVYVRICVCLSAL